MSIASYKHVSENRRKYISIIKKVRKAATTHTSDIYEDLAYTTLDTIPEENKNISFDLKENKEYFDKIYSLIAKLSNSYTHKDYYERETNTSKHNEEFDWTQVDEAFCEACSDHARDIITLKRQGLRNIDIAKITGRSMDCVGVTLYHQKKRWKHYHKLENRYHSHILKLINLSEKKAAYFLSHNMYMQPSDIAEILGVSAGKANQLVYKARRYVYTHVIQPFLLSTLSFYGYEINDRIMALTESIDSRRSYDVVDDLLEELIKQDLTIKDDMNYQSFNDGREYRLEYFYEILR